MTNLEDKPTIGVVGPCGSGKTTLTRSLQEHHITVRHIAQEHSYVPEMWKIISNPTFLVFLNVSFEIATQRRKLNWSIAEFEEQLRRLKHARDNADLVIDTDSMNPDDVLTAVLHFIQLKY
jgi:cytidylate kinase